MEEFKIAERKITERGLIKHIGGWTTGVVHSEGENNYKEVDFKGTLLRVLTREGKSYVAPSKESKEGVVLVKGQTRIGFKIEDSHDTVRFYDY